MAAGDGGGGGGSYGSQTEDEGQEDDELLLGSSYSDFDDNNSPEFYPRDGSEETKKGGYGEETTKGMKQLEVKIGETGKFTFREFLGFVGPGFLICVAYIDPGNFESDLQAGASYGYMLLWILLWSTLLGVLLQYLAVKLALGTGWHLARACRDEYPTRIRIPLWLVTELAIVASDIPEVIGTAFALKLLLGIPLWVGVLITGVDTLLFLAIQTFGVRHLEAFIGSLVATMGVCFVVQMFQAGVDGGALVLGLVEPRFSTLGSVYIAISLLGAVVMPHNLYLHSAMVLTRKIPKSKGAVKMSLKYNLVESFIAIMISLVINIAVVSVAASEFYTLKDEELRQEVQERPLQYGPKLLEGLLGKAAKNLFAVALLASGQSSTMTGTFAGQFVMEGFLNLKMSPALRNLITRSVAIVPSLVCALVAGDAGSEQLIVLSSVILAFQLPYAILPLLKLTNSKHIMGWLANGRRLRLAAGSTAILVVCANLFLLIYSIVDSGIVNKSVGGVFAGIFLALFGIFYVVSLVYIARRPVKQRLSIDEDILPSMEELLLSDRPRGESESEMQPRGGDISE